MANFVKTNPIFLDTFTGDIDLFDGHHAVVKSISFYSAVAGDRLVIVDKNLTPCVYMIADGVSNTELVGSDTYKFNNGPYTVKVSLGQYAASARALIYL